MSDYIGKLVQAVKAKEFQALAKLLTHLEREGAIHLANETLFNPPQKSLRIGITGPPGAGKSTLIGELIGEFRKKNLSVGVLAVDPSSPLSQGAILGDRIRYIDHFLDDQVFIRSLGTRGSLGGLSAASYLMLRAYDVFNFDVVLIETVGVGQTELEVVHVADLVSVVLVPESGDSIQAMKAGLLEIADLYILNKSDRPGADSLLNEIELNSEQSLIRGQKNKPKSFKTVATESKGIVELADFYLSHQETVSLHRDSLEYLRNEARAILRQEEQNRVEERIKAFKSKSDFKNLILGM